jgi:D-cysteine desulfhydrase
MGLDELGLKNISRIPLAFLPTPIMEASRLAAENGAIETTALELRSAGQRPYIIPCGGASVLGTLGYVQAVYELAEQCAAKGIVPDAIVLAIGSCGTQAGLLAGVQLLRLPWRVKGFTVSRPIREVQARVLTLAQAAIERLGFTQTIPPHRW